MKEGRQEARKEEGREGWLMLIVKLIRRHPLDVPWLPGWSRRPPAVILEVT